MYQDYNELPDDMREDRDVKAEWHRRADELLEKLWSICDTRKGDNDETKRSLMEACPRFVLHPISTIDIYISISLLFLIVARFCSGGRMGRGSHRPAVQLLHHADAGGDRPLSGHTSSPEGLLPHSLWYSIFASCFVAIFVLQFAFMCFDIPKAKCSTRWCGPSRTGCRCWRCQ